MDKPSITEQRQAVERLIAHAMHHDEIHDVTIDDAKQAVLTLGYIERNPDYGRALAVLMQQLPGARLEIAGAK